MLLVWAVCCETKFVKIAIEDKSVNFFAFKRSIHSKASKIPSNSCRCKYESSTSVPINTFIAYDLYEYHVFQDLP